MKLINHQAYKHPDSALATETTPTFASKYGDPTHPSVTAGYTGRISAKAKNETLAERQARKKEAALKPGSARGRVARILPNVSVPSCMTMTLLLVRANMAFPERSVSHDRKFAD